MMLRVLRAPRLRRDETGSMAIETAFVAPILLVLALGGFEVSTMVARHTELQSAAAEAAAVVRAVIPETAEDRATVRDIVAVSICGNYEPEVSGNAAVCGEDNVTSVEVTPLQRCGTAEGYVSADTDCGSEAAYQFIRVDLSDTYAPIWTTFGVSKGFDYNVSRTVQIG